MESHIIQLLIKRSDYILNKKKLTKQEAKAIRGGALSGGSIFSGGKNAVQDLFNKVKDYFKQLMSHTVTFMI